MCRRNTGVKKMGAGGIEKMSNGRILEIIKGRKLNSRLFTTMVIFEAFFRYFPSKAINSPSLGLNEEEREEDFFLFAPLQFHG